MRKVNLWSLAIMGPPGDYAGEDPMPITHNHCCNGLQLVGVPSGG